MKTKPIQEVKPKPNKTQKAVIQQLKLDIFTYDGNQTNPDNYEFKRFDIRQLEGSKLIFLNTTVGMKKDEGTMAEIFARTHRHIAIGPRGKVQLLNGVRVTKAGKRVPYKRRITKYWQVIHTLTRS